MTMNINSASVSINIINYIITGIITMQHDYHDDHDKSIMIMIIMIIIIRRRREEEIQKSSSQQEGKEIEGAWTRRQPVHRAGSNKGRWAEEQMYTMI